MSFLQQSLAALSFFQGKLLSRLPLFQHLLPPRLVDLGIELTFRCNLSCVMCPLAKDKGLLSETQELKVADWTKFLDELSSFARPMVTLTGAEPMLYEGWEKIGIQARKRGFQITVQTNGTFLEEYAEVTPKAVDVLHVSIDGTEKVHDKVRKEPGSFSKTLQGLLALEKKRKKGRPAVSIFFTLNELNYLDLKACLQFFQGLNLDVKQFVVRHPLFLPEKRNFSQDFAQKFGVAPSWDPYQIHENRGVPVYRPSSIDVERLKEELEAAKQVKTPLLSFFPDLCDEEIKAHYQGEHLSRFRRCVAPWLSAAVGPNGDFYLCPYFSVGNIREKSVRNLWQNARAVSFRQRLFRVRHHDLCRTCPNLYLHG